MAARVNGITPEMVKDKVSIAEDMSRIISIFNNAKLIVGYNVAFDLNMLLHNLPTLGSFQKFAIFDVYRNYKYLVSLDRLPVLVKHTLKNVSEYFVFTVPACEHLHDAITDVKATLFSYKKLLSYMD